MTMALANMQIVISRLLRSLRITKGPTRWLTGEPHRQRTNLSERPGGHKGALHPPRTSYRVASSEDFEAVGIVRRSQAGGGSCQVVQARRSSAQNAYC